MLTLLQDLRVGLRMLARNPGFATTAILTLALGVGATTVIFSIIDGVILRSLPYEAPERLISISSDNAARALKALAVSFTKLERIQQQSQTLEGISAYLPITASLTGSGAPEQVFAAQATANFFPLLGISPAASRLFTAQEDRKGGSDIALITDSFWHSHFAADPSVIGRQLSLSRR